MKRTELEAKIDEQLKLRGEFIQFVTRKTKFRLSERLAFEVMPHGNPAIDSLVYSVRACDSDGVPNFDYTVNRNFETREQFLNALMRYLKNERKNSL